MHVVGLASFPLSKSAVYMPSPHSLTDAMAFEAKLGIRNIVLVQPSFYGTDNSCLLESLRQLGSTHARAIVVFDPENINQDTLEEWHSLGVRRVRLNLRSSANPWDRPKILQALKQYADLIKPLGWVLQLYAELEVAEWIEDLVPALGIKVCFDHFGYPELPVSHEDYAHFEIL